MFDASTLNFFGSADLFLRTILSSSKARIVRAFHEIIFNRQPLGDQLSVKVSNLTEDIFVKKFLPRRAELARKGQALRSYGIVNAAREPKSRAPGVRSAYSTAKQ